MLRLTQILVSVLFASLLTCNLAVAATDDGQQTIVIFGASGKIGSLIVENALMRGHTVIGVSRRPENLAVEHENFTAAQGDVTNGESFTRLVQGVDSAVISVRGDGAGNKPENTTHARAANIAISSLEGMRDPPYVLQVGGATSIYEDRDEMVANLPMHAEEGTPFYAMLFGHLVALEAYRASDIDWTVITPPYEIVGWSRDGITETNPTGEYRTSTTEHLYDASGKNSIDVADLAAAVVDELENRLFVRQRFMVGY